MYVANLNQSRSAFIRAPNFYFICYISSVIFVCRLLAASFCVPLPPSCIVGTAAGFSRWGRIFPFSHKWFLSRLLFFIGRSVIKCGLVILLKKTDFEVLAHLQEKDLSHHPIRPLTARADPSPCIPLVRSSILALKD